MDLTDGEIELGGGGGDSACKTVLTCSPDTCKKDDTSNTQEYGPNRPNTLNLGKRRYSFKNI